MGLEGLGFRSSLLIPDRQGSRSFFGSCVYRLAFEELGAFRFS